MLKLLKSKRGEGYIDVCVLVLCSVLVIALAVKVFPVFIAKNQLDTFATELCREAEISGKQIAEWMRQLKLSGAGNYGYYPDDFISDKPEMSEIRSTFSSYWYPQK